METEKFLEKLNESLLKYFMFFKKIAQDEEDGSRTIVALSPSRRIKLSFFYDSKLKIIYSVDAHDISVTHLSQFCNIVTKILEEGE